MEYPHLQRIYDGVVKTLNDEEPMNSARIDEILVTGLMEPIIEMDKAESPKDVWEFFENWYERHRIARRSDPYEKDENLGPRDEVKAHLSHHRQALANSEAIYDWLL